MNRWFVIGGLLLLVAWFPFLLREWTRGDPADVQDPAVQGQGEAPLEPNRPVAVVPKPLKAVPRPVEGAPQEPEPAEVEAPEPEVEDQAPEPEEPLEEDGEEVAQAPPVAPYVKQLKAAFETETRDSLWAKPREEALHAQVEQRGIRLRGEEGDAIRCQRTVCRIGLEVTQEETSRMRGFYVSLLADRSSDEATEEAAPTGADVPDEEQAPSPAAPERVFGLETLSSDAESTQVFLYVSRAGYSFSPN